MLDISALQAIKKELNHGSLMRIQKEAGVSYVTVQKFFKGDSQNPLVCQAVINEYKKQLALKNEVENLKPEPQK